MSLLQNRVALLTGASAGIGAETARLFAAEGARLVLCARRQPALETLAGELSTAGHAVEILAGDVSDPDFAQRAVDFTLNRFGRLDVALNNAGQLGAGVPVTELSLETWRHTLDVNLTSAFLAAKAQIPALLHSPTGGSLVFTSSFVGVTAGLPGMADYAAAKAGLTGLVKCLACEYGARGLRVNALLPGGTDTPMGRQAADTPEKVAFVENLHALKRLAHPAEIARAALFLASDLSGFVTGSSLLADGGASVCRA